MGETRQYRGWTIEIDYRRPDSMTYCALHPAFDGAEDGCPIQVFAADQEGIEREIDEQMEDIA